MSAVGQKLPRRPRKANSALPSIADIAPHDRHVSKASSGSPIDAGIRSPDTGKLHHLTPSCGGFTPTAERTVSPARTIVGELDTQTRNLEQNLPGGAI